MTQAILSLGTNQGDRLYYISEMERRLKTILHEPYAASALMETEPLGMPPDSSWFLNRIVSGIYMEGLDFLHDRCREIETALGRVRGKGIADRTADIDILLFGDTVITNTNLTVPHPRIIERRFCLEGLRQVAPCLRHPFNGRTFMQMYDSMPQIVRRQQIRVIEQHVENENRRET